MLTYFCGFSGYPLVGSEDECLWSCSGYGCMWVRWSRYRNNRYNNVLDDCIDTLLYSYTIANAMP